MARTSGYWSLKGYTKVQKREYRMVKKLHGTKYAKKWLRAKYG